MIESITISNIASFTLLPEELNDLSKFNFLFGSNGTGKTTVSRVIAEEAKFPTCKVTWKAGIKLQPLVYNHDFVERNFSQSAELKGVFTLGKKQVDTLMKIAEAKRELDALTNTIANLTHGLEGSDGKGGKNGELTILEAGFKDKCWAQKQKYDAQLRGGFEGYRNNAENFKTKVLQEHASNTTALLNLEALVKKAESIFGPTPTAEAPVPAVDMSQLLAHESNPILKKRVIGKNDVDIAAMVKKIGNSDWVREGKAFYDTNEGICPFCQRGTTEAFARSLNEYFDDVFVTDSKAIDDLAANYTTDAARVHQQIEDIISAPSKFLDVDKLKIKKELLDAKITLNQQRLAEKRRETSRVVELEPAGKFATIMLCAAT